MKFSFVDTLTEDPERAMQVGETLVIESRRFPLEQARDFFQVANWGVFRGAVLAVAFPGPGGLNVCGSAAIVAPGLAIGALHVFHHAAAEVMANQAAAFCIGLDPPRADIWRIRYVITSDSGRSDIAVFSLQLASALPADRTLRQAWMSTRTPAIGESLTSVGFRQGVPLDIESDTPAVGMSLFASRGTVTQQHPRQRDSFGLSCPCVEVQCETLGGMSGGPVFDAQGNIVGVLSRGLEGGPSWVSLLWPALGWKIKGGWPAELMKTDSRLIELDPRICRIDGREALRLHNDGREQTYEPWSELGRQASA